MSRRSTRAEIDVRWLEAHLADDGRVPPVVRQAVDAVWELVQCASLRPPGGPHTLPLRCRRRPGRRPCRSHLRVHVQEVPPVLLWECPGCGDEGRIINWRRSRWDLHTGEPSTGAPADEGPRLRVAITFDQWRAACDTVWNGDSARFLYAATAGTDGVILDNTLYEFDEYACELETVLTTERSPSLRRRLGALFDTLVVAIEQHDPGGTIRLRWERP